MSARTHWEFLVGWSCFLACRSLSMLCNWTMRQHKRCTTRWEKSLRRRGVKFKPHEDNGDGH